jgi:TATA-binding protein-associated factor
VSGSASVQQRRRTDSPVRAFRTPLPALIPRLFAFFRHTITSVRLAVVRTFLVFLRLPTLAPSWVDATFCRLLFQNLLLEERAEIREATFSAWTACLARLGPSVPALVTAQINNWFALLNTQIGTAIDRRLLSFGASGDSTSEGTVYSVDKPMLNQDLALVTPESILRCRVAAATAIGALMSAWPGVLPNDFKQQIESGLQSASALQRTLAAIVIEEWASRPHSQPLP